jgi:hypothetical protein
VFLLKQLKLAHNPGEHRHLPRNHQHQPQHQYPHQQWMVARNCSLQSMTTRWTSCSTKTWASKMQRLKHRHAKLHHHNRQHSRILVALRLTGNSDNKVAHHHSGAINQSRLHQHQQWCPLRSPRSLLR